MIVIYVVHVYGYLHFKYSFKPLYEQNYKRRIFMKRDRFTLCIMHI